MKNLDLVSLRIYDPVVALDKFKKNKIKIYHLRKVDDYVFHFYVKRNDYEKVAQIFNEVKLVRRYGFIENIFKIIRQKTIIGIVVAIVVFLVLSNRIFLIEIDGDAQSLIPLVSQEVQRLGIKKMQPLKSNIKIKEIEYSALQALQQNIEYLEIRQVGVKVKIRFQKRRTVPPLPGDRSSLYATKDAIIKSFEIKKGLIVVKENQFVKKGDLLVNQFLMTTSGEEIYLGCEGFVFGYTWTNLDLTWPMNELDDEVTYFTQLIQQARGIIGKELSQGEFMDSENIIFFGREGSEYRLKVNYILVEDITI